VHEERLVIGRPPRVLEAILWSPEGRVRAGAVLCHPHPQYGGDMHVAVIVAIAQALVERDVAALRFNFGGVGRSGGAYDGGRAEQRDVAVAVEALAGRLDADVPLALIGYSFGAWVAAQAARDLSQVNRVVAVAPPLALLDWRIVDRLRLPLAVVVGDHDAFCPDERLAALGELAVVTRLEGADHFLVGYETRVAEAVCAHLGVQ